MQRKLLKSKIHRATITAKSLHYEGSITLPETLMHMADIREYEHVCIWDVNNGARFETYAISGEGNTICLNGAAARMAEVGDIIIIATFGYYDEDVTDHRPSIVKVNSDNEPI